MTWLILVAVLPPVVTFPQRQEDGHIRVGIHLRGGVNGGARLYAEQDRVEYSLNVSNESQAAIFVDQEVLRSVIATRVEADGEVPVAVSWPHEVMVQGATATTRFDRWQPVQLNPGESVWFTLTLERQDHQRFEEGRYAISFVVSGFETAIQRTDGTPWRGITNADGTWRRGITIRRPETSREQLDAYLADAAAALDRGDHTALVDAWLKASALYPDNRTLRLRLGLAYLVAGRYREAIPIYESHIAGVAVPDPMVARDLAKAYVGVRDEGNAVRVLRMSGVPESEIRGELDTLRRGLR